MVRQVHQKGVLRVLDATEPRFYRLARFLLMKIKRMAEIVIWILR